MNILHLFSPYDWNGYHSAVSYYNYKIEVLFSWTLQSQKWGNFMTLPVLVINFFIFYDWKLKVESVQKLAKNAYLVFFFQIQLIVRLLSSNSMLYENAEWTWVSNGEGTQMEFYLDSWWYLQILQVLEGFVWINVLITLL